MSSTLIDDLCAIVGVEHVRQGEADRIAYSSDMWPRHQIWKMGGDICRHSPRAVVWPANEDEIIELIKCAAGHGIAVIPYGAGSGVCGATVPLHGELILDLKRLNKVSEISDLDLTVTAQPGIVGMHLEQELAESGYTLGHFPSSILCSTLGGWLAARSAGQLSSKYGKIEDMVISLRAVMPDGSIMETGPGQVFDWTQLIVGSEGTLGIVTEACLRIHPAAEAQAFRGYRFRTIESGQMAIRQMMQAGLEPHVIRLYDPFDSLLHSSDDESGGGGAVSSLIQPLRELLGGRMRTIKRGLPRVALATALGRASMLNALIAALPVSSLLILGFEGRQEHVESDLNAACQIMEKAGGVDGGEGPGKRWLAHRYNISFKQSAIFDSGAFADTMEVSCTWSRLNDVYRAVREAVSPSALIMAHFSHAYREGCSIYFTFAGYKSNPEAVERLYDKVWSDALGAVVRAGASISHHHGIGIAKRDLMGREHGAGIHLLYALKDGIDPSEQMNPGKLLPERAVVE